MRRAVAIFVLVFTSSTVLAGAASAQETASPAIPDADVSWLEECGTNPLVLCGTMTRPLDPQEPGGETIDINVEFYPARNPQRPLLGTVVAVEGGPGYSTTASRDYYLELFKPILSQRQFLLIDNRGTGYSSAVDCSELQSYEGDYYENVALCGETLGDTSDLWGSALAADDMAAVLDALAIEQIDLYGDSYGTFFGQTFAVRHPDKVRTLILDAAYPVEDQDPWYRDLNRAVATAFRNVCERDPGCVALGIDPLETLRKLADALTDEPLEGSAPDADGAVQDVVVDVPMLTYLAAVATYGSSVYRELEAAARAYLDHDDPLPLLRIASEQSAAGGGDAIEDFSEGLYVANICNDYPQLWDISTDIDDRPAQFEAAYNELVKTDPEAFAPFTVDEWLASSWVEYESCMGWPAPSTWVAPYQDGFEYPDTPTLVLVGDLDTITSPEGAEKAAHFFPNATFVEVVNVAHVTALVDFSRCASDIVLRFIGTGGDPGDTGCAARYNEVRVVEHFPTTLEAVEWIPGLGSGNRGKAVLAATHTVTDMVSRWYTMYGEAGVGLRGGTFATTGLTNVSFSMDGLMWVEDLEVSGTAVWNRANGSFVADVDLSGAATGSLTISWNEWRPTATAHAVGTVDGRRVNWWFAAP